MIKLIVGKKGSGKTKQLIEMVNQAASEHAGSILCIENGNSLTLDINHDARLIDYSEYPLTGFNAFAGFLFGCYAQNYDLVHVFIDNLLKIVKVGTDEELAAFIELLASKSEAMGIDFTMIISKDVEELPESIRKYAC